MRAFSSDLRERIVAAVSAGAAPSEAARRFAVGVSTVSKYRRQFERLGHVQPLPKVRKSPRKLEPHRERIEGWIGEEPGVTLAALVEKLKGATGVSTGITTMHKALRAWGLTLKKKR